MMPRILEQEVMDDPMRVYAYAVSDFSFVDELFLKYFLASYHNNGEHILDIGCGPARIPIQIARIFPSAIITAVDASTPMLGLARDAAIASNVQNQVQLVRAHIPNLPLKPHSFDTIISLYALHHIPDPMLFWEEVKRMGAPGTEIMIMDLFRPKSAERAKKIVETIAAKEHPLLKEDFYNSLLAAFTIAEVREQLVNAELSHLSLEKASERHMIISGILGS